LWALRIPLKTQQRLLLDATLAIVNDSWEPDLRGQSGMGATSVGKSMLTTWLEGRFRAAMLVIGLMSGGLVKALSPKL